MFTTILLEPLANGLILFYRLLGSNLGLAIIFFSIFLRFILQPLTKPYMDSMKKMRQFAPQLAKLKKKYKNEPAKFTKAQADFYREKGIKPGAGCLPYILQFIILIAFFQVFTRTLSPDSNPTESFNNLLYSPLKFTNGDTLHVDFLYLDLTKPDTWNVSLLPFALPGPLLILSAISQFLSAKIMQPYVSAEEKVAKQTKGSADDMQAAMQQSMIYTFPLFTLIIGIQFSSALALYWLTFSLFQLYQQYKSSGWGGLTPWLKKLNLIESVS